MSNPVQKITPFLWFDSQAEEAMNFYTSVFENSQIIEVRRYPEGPLDGPMQGMEGKVLTAVFELEGQPFMALDGGPHFKFTPAVSFFVTCETEAEIDKVWEVLAGGGSVLMPLQPYPFSAKFGWVEDKYGLSWQLNLAAGKQKITPFLMFVGAQHGKAEEAMNFYTSLFKNSGIGTVVRYGAGEEGSEGSVKHATFKLSGQEFMAMESNLEHAFTFTEATSFYVSCDTQEEVDHLWQELSADPAAEQCAWLKDRYGVSWQIVPTILPELLNDPDPEKARRVMQAVLQMKKIDIEGLKQAYEQQ